MSASTAPLPEDMDGLRAQNRAYRSLCASLEAAQAIQTDQGRKYQEAITTLDSEREANARLTDEVERLRDALESVQPMIDHAIELEGLSEPCEAEVLCGSSVCEYAGCIIDKAVAIRRAAHTTPNPGAKP